MPAPASRDGAQRTWVEPGRWASPAGWGPSPVRERRPHLLQRTAGKERTRVRVSELRRWALQTGKGAASRGDWSRAGLLGLHSPQSQLSFLKCSRDLHHRKNNKHEQKRRRSQEGATGPQAPGPPRASASGCTCSLAPPLQGGAPLLQHGPRPRHRPPEKWALAPECPHEEGAAVRGSPEPPPGVIQP